MSKSALIVGTGSGISAAFAELLAREGYRLALVSREPSRFAELAAHTKAVSLAADASQPADIARVFSEANEQIGVSDVVLYNASFRTRGPFIELVPADVHRALEVGAYGAFLVGQEAARRMLPKGQGTIIFTGASASIKGYAQSAPFAMAKFALRGLAQSMARELHPKGIHVTHVNIDGGVRNAARGSVEEQGGATDSLLDPVAIAETYLSIVRQPRSAWSQEVELRPWVERF